MGTSANLYSLESGSSYQEVGSRTNCDKSDDRKKRTTLACVKCRKRHIKCDGLGKPCSRCVSLGYECEYIEADRKVVVSVKYLNKLQSEISKLKIENTNLRTALKKFGTNLVINDIETGNISSDDELDKDLVFFDDDSKKVQSGMPVLKTPTKNNISKILGSSSEELNASKNRGLYSSNQLTMNSDKKTQEIIPPFLDKYGRLIHSRTGEKIYIGSSSMTLFGLEINRLVSPMLNNFNNNHNYNKDSSIPDASPDSVSSAGTTNFETETILEKEGNAYRIMLGKTHSRPGINVNFTLPSYSYAMLLVDSFISYNDGCFYFFNEGLVKENLRRIYNEDSDKGFKPDYGIDSLNNATENESILETIWFCKVMLIFAIGEMYLGTANYLNGNKINEKPKKKKQKLKSKSTTTKLPGSGFFNQASELFTGLFASGSIDNCTREGGIEVLLLYAFYLQVADCTTASYFYFGIALRASLLLGLHVDVGKDTLNRYELEHRRRLWWTVYMYERMLASKAGLPLSLTDEDISTELPNDFDMSHPPTGCENYIFPEAEFISNCVKITQINANILRRLYTRQPSTNILPIVHQLVVSLLNWKKALPEDINCDYNQPELNISRLVVNMMTEYLQGINLAVRPLLFHFVLINLKSSNPREGTFLDLSKYSSVILTLLNASFQASINTIRSLWALVPENMVAMFGYMDREYLFNATATLVLFNATFGVHDATLEHLDHALTLFTRMRNLGNHPATLRREQILKLLTILDFNGAMSELIRKHNDNGHAPVSSPNNDESFGHKYTMNKNKVSQMRSGLSANAVPPPSIPSLQSQSAISNPQLINLKLNNGTLNDHSTNFSNHAEINPNNWLNNNDPQNVSQIFSPSLLPLLNQIEDVPNFEALHSTANDLELWKDVTNQAAWLGSDMGDEFGQLFNQLYDNKNTKYGN